MGGLRARKRVINGGIGGGIGPLKKGQTVPPGILTYGARYDGMMEALGGKGIFVEDPKDLRAALDEAMAFDGLSLIHISEPTRPY